MRIVDLLNKESIMLGGSPKNKSEAIDMLVELQVKGGNIADKDEYKRVFLPVRKRVQQLSARESRYLTQRAKR